MAKVVRKFGCYKQTPWLWVWWVRVGRLVLLKHMVRYIYSLISPDWAIQSRFHFDILVAFVMSFLAVYYTFHMFLSLLRYWPLQIRSFWPRRTTSSPRFGSDLGSRWPNHFKIGRVMSGIMSCNLYQPVMWFNKCEPHIYLYILLIT